jgi:hypothetical protein
MQLSANVPTPCQHIFNVPAAAKRRRAVGGDVKPCGAPNQTTKTISFGV